MENEQLCTNDSFWGCPHPSVTPGVCHTCCGWGPKTVAGFGNIVIRNSVFAPRGLGYGAGHSSMGLNAIKMVDTFWLGVS